MHFLLQGLIKLIISYPYVRAVDRETFRRGEVSVISLTVRFFVSSRSDLLALYLKKWYELFVLSIRKVKLVSGEERCVASQRTAARETKASVASAESANALGGLWAYFLRKF